LNPTEPSCEQRVRYLADGTIESGDQALDADLIQTLNLNHARLKRNRMAFLDGFRKAMERKYPGLTWPEAAMMRELERLQQFDADGMLQPYCQVPIYWLKKRLGRLASSGRA
jgi:hypothetical protein